MPATRRSDLQFKARCLTAVCLLLWIAATLAPIWAARRGDLGFGDWPLDFWMAAQGCVLAYLLIVALYAWLINRWEKEAGALSFDVPPDQEV